MPSMLVSLGSRLPASSMTTCPVESLEPGDTIIDGGNSFYKDDVRRMKILRGRKIHYVDVGTSGGVRGLEGGYCLMLGGGQGGVERLDPILPTVRAGVGTGPRPPRPGEVPGTPG